MLSGGADRSINWPLGDDGDDDDLRAGMYDDDFEDVVSEEDIEESIAEDIESRGNDSYQSKSSRSDHSDASEETPNARQAQVRMLFRVEHMCCCVRCPNATKYVQSFTLTC